MMRKCDFSGWATKNDLLCSDGRTIRKNAFKNQDGAEIPLVWNHNHSDPDNVLGHALLENRDEGVYAYCSFNENESGKTAKELVKHGDVRSLSIFANQLKQNGNDVIHGVIREVSLVLSGANPGAFIDSVMAHGEDSETGLILGYDENIMLYHSDETPQTKTQTETKEESKKETAMSDKEQKEETKNEKTVQQVFDEFTDEQKDVVYALIAEAIKTNNEEKNDEENKEDTSKMKHNAFENENEKDELMHGEMMDTIIKDAKRYGSMKESFLQHSGDYGIDNIDYLFPEDRAVENTPTFIKRDTTWVDTVINGVYHTPFSRVKTIFADITEDEARAKGYIKGTLKKDEVFSLLKRSTDPTTIYKKQKLDKNDIDDITDFDVLSWIKTEMRMMLNEEIARSILIGDGRLSSDDDKIDPSHIRPIINDSDLFVIRWSVATSVTPGETEKNFIKAAIKSRKNYRGSGNPVLYTTEDWLTNMLLLEDSQGYPLYKTEAELATKLRVSKIITVPVMENCEDKDSKDIYGIIVNLKDYGVGADKGGSINMFDDFDIDYNQMKYLMETRCSGALRKPFSAIVLRSGTATQSEEPTLAEAKAQLNN